MSEECKQYFKEHPASVSKCESILKVQSEAQNIIIDYLMGGLTKVHIEKENDFFNLKEEYGNVSQYERYYTHSIRLKTNQKK